ncbi:MAG: GatB/YqeY domain-containing protein [Gammaproteobacteria bacterium]|nr:GatB/YqeY domain-containing protein [Gammaproteobacteria bacterium]MCP4088522.1 GatB/YqeY domain-containing protein [Gammaproteobacteria bacterium]MCP4276738.1 GatB/YqeY domain-containing protein [Gammaproteobacteria bacterium]MCP4833059.1 GatB/YqeY domain-containing protein [Gammaproteobacteria bacterium]MCP4928390.1 GatB/YqeY domain-containing protein [Gammaproteobacteria bacterium]
MSLKEQIRSDMKDAMRAGEKDRLSVIRMLLAAIQTREIEAREDLSDNEVMQIIEKLIKQRKDSAKQFADAGRNDRAAQESSEGELLQTYLPEQLGEAELESMLNEVLASTGANSMKDMGKVMTAIRKKAQGQADMGALSALVKSKLAG